MDWFSGRNASTNFWVPTSEKILEEAETKMLEGVESPLKSLYVCISHGNQIRTLYTNQQFNRVPIILLHGFGAGLAFWRFCLDSLSETRNVYAFDLLGFGRSSRPDFPDDADEIESLFVDSIEEWRQQMNLDKMILLGHSFGGYIFSLYALKYPKRVSHLILADPWGFPEEPLPGEEKIPVTRYRTVVKIFTSINPFSIIRLAGPYGQFLLNKVRVDLKERYEGIFGEGDTRAMDYIYHCNVQKPSGETAFMSLTSLIIYAKKPLINRIKYMDKHIPLTVLYGAESWTMRLFDFSRIRMARPDSYVTILSIQNAGHHIFADQPDDFNHAVNEICNMVDSY